MEEKTVPLLERYDQQRQKQQKLIRLFKYLSPAILMQQSLNHIAETSEEHYNANKEQVFEFLNRWSALLIRKSWKFRVLKSIVDFRFYNLLLVSKYILSIF